MTRSAPATSESRWLTPPAVADQLGIDPSKVIAWIGSGTLVAVNVAQGTGGRPRWRIAPSELQAFLLRRQSRPSVQLQRRRKDTPEAIPFF